METFDQVIVGGGPAGYVAALRASGLGQSTALVENRELGGTCLNRGCIPSKTLLQNAEAVNYVRNASKYGIQVEGFYLRYKDMLERKDRVIRQLRQGVESLMKKGDIEVFAGRGKVHPNKEVTVISKDGEETVLAGRAVIIASGSVPAVPPIPGLEETGYYTSDTIYERHSLPETMTIVGGGFIGCEYACLYQSLGVRVTIVESAGRLVPQEDEDAANMLAGALEEAGVVILTSATVTSAKQQGEKAVIDMQNASGSHQQLTTDLLLISTGRTPVIAAAEDLQLRMDGRFVAVDGSMQTSVPGIYAAGDIVGGWQLAHAASAEGIIAAEHAAGAALSMDLSLVPRCVYTFPEIASVGLSEQEAKQMYSDVQIKTVPLRGNAKAMTMGESRGFIKVISREMFGEILGVVMAGPHVTEMIGESAAYIHLEGTTEEWSSQIHAHPSLSEMLFEGVSALSGRPVHQ
ncbi:dihydrolipoyl dehydrogenase [Marinococcus halophilus]|uniref:Dihydrolipoyl dehydrogenase n=1 Tax=Marinococcus halophilus TaxID=1371 RepID=A0A510Y816_MARHA|nr:dihydrolipoyl dehydrogenase [Marinococcus halophilus]OZT81821.1 dihydrolipoyl dehydrogenase [Marinococcus halophilus]GEK59313.1 dihydrolipoyl dehydrogenase [Marinococcus halophilus]